MPRGVSRTDEARLQKRLWNPSLLASNSAIAMWLDVDDLSTITIATGVSQWRDKSGNGRNAIQNLTGYQPTITTVNGKRSLFFGGSAFMTITVNDHQGLFLVYRDSSTVGYVEPIGAVLTSAKAPYHGHLNNTQIFNSTFTSSATLNGINRRNGTSIGDGLTTARPSSLCVQSHVPTSAYTSTQALTHVGCNNFSPPSRAITGEINEVIVLLSGAVINTIELIEGYLAWKWWGSDNTLVASHPFRNQPPLIGD